MARSCECRTCGKTIRPKAKDMSLGAAVRMHYWKQHPDVMRPKQKSTATARKRAG